MAQFYLRQMRNSARDIIIGWSVISRSQVGGERLHYSRQAQGEAGLARAKADCAAVAARLEAEAEANRARGR